MVKNCFSAAKERSLVALCEQLGVPLRQYPSGWRGDWTPCCGWSEKAIHGRGVSNRLWISPDDRTWYCHVCGHGGSIVDFLALYEGTDPLEAAKRLVSEESPRRRPLPHLPSQEEREEVARVIWEATSSALEKDKRAPRKWLVNERKIKPEVVVEAENRNFLRYLPNIFRLKRQLEPRGELLKKVGEKILVLARYPLVFPFYRKGRVVGVEMRRVDASSQYPKTRSRGVKTAFWWRGEGEEVLVVEGALDLLSAVSLGWKGPVLGLPGVGSKKIVVEIARARETWRWLLCLDPDEAGRAAALYLQSTLRTMGRTVKVLSLPEGQDLNDLLKAGEIRSFADLLSLT